MKKNIVITGMSTGIGLAIGQRLLREGYRVFGSVRREADATRLRDDLGEDFHPLVFDVTDNQAIQQGAEETRRIISACVEQNTSRSTVAGLVNNAGIAVSGPMLHVPVESLRQQLEVNVIGAAAVTQAFAPLLGADGPATGKGARQRGNRASANVGRILNISSVSGRITYPFMGPYAASKHALEAMSDCLRMELKGYGIPVVLVEPGAISTPIWAKARQSNLAEQYAHTGYAASIRQMAAALDKSEDDGLPVERVAELVSRIMRADKPRARYLLSPNPLQYHILRHLPTTWKDHLLARRLGILK